MASSGNFKSGHRHGCQTQPQKHTHTHSHISAKPATEQTDGRALIHTPPVQRPSWALGPRPNHSMETICSTAVVISSVLLAGHAASWCQRDRRPGKRNQTSCRTAWFKQWLNMEISYTAIFVDLHAWELQYDDFLTCSLDNVHAQKKHLSAHTYQVAEMQNCHIGVHAMCMQKPLQLNA